MTWKVLTRGKAVWTAMKRVPPRANFLRPANRTNRLEIRQSPISRWPHDKFDVKHPRNCSEDKIRH
jgi:hypothetical protein